MKIALLASGNLGFSIFKVLNQEEEIVSVLTDKSSLDIIEFCRENSIPCFVGNPRGGRADTFLSDTQPFLLLSVNYLFLIESDIISWPSFLPLNIHGSLLPKYRGRTPHVWSIINNEKEAGITVHVIDEFCDSGDIVAQKRIPIEKNDTGADVLKKYAESYPTLIKEVLNLVKSNSLTRTKQNELNATYFGKRTPDDGQIDWDWQKERIRNWVRAQASPYPGAFSFLGDNKIIIDEIQYSDVGFNDHDTNGLVLSNDNNPIIKTPNGAVELTKVREFDKKEFNQGEILR